jgi:ABC-2 type transport system ATP-binding protein
MPTDEGKVHSDLGDDGRRRQYQSGDGYAPGHVENGVAQHKRDSLAVVHPGADPAIRVQDLRKSFGTLEVLRGVNFEVARGSIFALLGSNGAGKTTAVKILSTLLRSDAGSAAVNGFDVAAQGNDVRESISLTGQFAAVDEILTGRENLVLISKLRHVPDPVATVDALLQQFSLTDAAGRRVSTYSGGMRRRLDIAMSLIGDPPVVFLDEPTTGLDPEARIEVWKTVKGLAGRGTTVLLTTQYLEEAEHLADRIAILHQGRIIVNGTLDELKQLLPPTKVEYVEKKPTLEDVFFAIVGDRAGNTPTAEPRPTPKDES